MRGAAPRHRRGHRRHARRRRAGVQRPGEAAGGGRHQDHPHRGGVAHRRAGGHHSQDVRGHVQGHPRHPHQAGRPSAQYAHTGGPARGSAHLQVPRDAGDLRPHRPPPWHQLHQVGAGGPVFLLPGAQQVQAGFAHGHRKPRGTRGVSGRRHRHHPRREGQGGHPGPGHGTSEASVLHLPEDDEEGQGILRDLRPHRRAHHREIGARLLLGARRGAYAVAPDAGVASKTTSPCPSSTCTSRCTPR